MTGRGASSSSSKGLENCLYVYPADGYREFLENLMSASDFNRNSRAVRRFFTAGATEVDIDSAGRVSLSPPLREFASLSKDVVVAGVGDHIEIWDAGRVGRLRGRERDNDRGRRRGACSYRHPLAP